MFTILAAGLSAEFTDTFNRANGSVINNWQMVGSWVIAGNLVRVTVPDPATAETRPKLYRETVVTDGWAECVPLDEGIGPMVHSKIGEANPGRVIYAEVAGGLTRLVQTGFGGFPAAYFQTVHGTSPIVPNLTTDSLAVEAIDVGSSQHLLRVYVNGGVVIEETGNFALDNGVRGIIAVTDGATVEADNYAEGV